jgi:hypothetical protein
MSGINHKLVKAMRQNLSLFVFKSPRAAAKGSAEFPRWLVKSTSAGHGRTGSGSFRSKAPWIGVACLTGAASGAAYIGMRHYGIQMSDLFPETRVVHVVPAELAIPMPPLGDNRYVIFVLHAITVLSASTLRACLPCSLSLLQQSFARAPCCTAKIFAFPCAHGCL